MYTHVTSPTTSVLGSLRQLIPLRTMTFSEARRIAELQASKLSDLIGDERGILEQHVAALPRIQITRDNLPVSGMSHWNGQQWIICLNRADSLVRQRFTLLHEYKHIVDHGHLANLYTGTARLTRQEQAEAAADYFAGCALVGKRQLKSAWGDGVQNVPDLATYFGVSEQAIAVRLAQTGLNLAVDRTPTPRCRRPVSTPAGQRQRFQAVQPRYARRYA